MSALGRLIENLVTEYGGTKKDLAQAVGLRQEDLSPSRTGKKEHPYSVEVCLRLALVTSTSPQQLLRAAGHGVVNDLIESLYGPPGKFEQRGFRVKPIEQKHLRKWRALRGPGRRALEFLLDSLSAESTPTTERSA